MYNCQCDEQKGYLPSPDNLSCRRCSNPCKELNDPCQETGNSGNVCIHSALSCGQHSCMCSAFGYVKSEGGKACVKCDNPCDRNPCSAGNGNTCVPLYLTGADHETCSTDYVCQCGAPGYLPAADSKSCTMCIGNCDEDGDAVLSYEGTRCYVSPPVRRQTPTPGRTRHSPALRSCLPSHRLTYSCHAPKKSLPATSSRSHNLPMTAGMCGPTRA